jgi:NTP pyrophosphatase (non-canonical NTP hydrolase)
VSYDQGDHTFKAVSVTLPDECYWCDLPPDEHALTITRMENEAWRTSEDHGFHDVTLEGWPTNIVKHYLSSKIALIHSEASEALEDLRGGNHAAKLSAILIETEDDENPGKPYGFLVELADIVIRCGDLAGIVGGDLEEAVRVKMAYNKTRPHKHGKAL